MRHLTNDELLTLFEREDHPPMEAYQEAVRRLEAAQERIQELEDEVELLEEHLEDLT